MNFVESEAEAASVPPMSVISPPEGFRLLLVDGHAYAYRAFHAIRSLRAPDGAPTNAIYGFIKMLEKLRALLRPTHILVTWDAGLAVERVAHLPDYKANRPPTPPDLEAQIPQIIDWVGDVGLASWSSPGTEADDWMATYAQRASDSGWEAIIASSDKDFMQLVRPGVALFNPGDKLERLWGPAEVEAKTGVRPEQVVDWLSLVGDAVDNIPGAPGVGPKTAAELLKRFGNIDSLYQGLVGIKSAVQRANLEGAESAVRRNQKMICLWSNLEGGPALSALSPRTAATDRLRHSYKRWGFKSMLAEIDLPRAGDLSQGSLW